jgi:DNA-binding response OmpR family regulator
VARRILVVDDEPSIVVILTMLLEATGFDVETASDGEQAVDRARRNPPDLILMDVMMPRMDGYEACQVLKADPATCHVPVVMISAKAQEADAVYGRKVGADAYLTKPFEPAAVLAEVQRRLA